MIIQNYNNPIMLYIIDNQKLFLNQFEQIITSKLLDFKLTNGNMKISPISLNINNKNIEKISKEIEKEFIEIIFNRLKYKSPFINEKILSEWFSNNKKDIIEYLENIIKFNYYN